MPFPLLHRLSLAAAALLVPTTILITQWQAPVRAQEQASLAGQLLIATPDMRDTRFDHAVILMVRHDLNGAMGIVINQPLEERPLSALLNAIGETATGAEGSIRIFYGGPVQSDAGFVIHSTDYHRAATIEIAGGFAMTSNRDVIRDIANKQGPKKSLVAFGYAGWAPGQLEGEIDRRSWYLAPADETLVFDQDRDKVWEDATAHRTQDL